jgi:hypothetical protein
MVPLIRQQWGEVKLLAIGILEGSLEDAGERPVQAGAVSYFGRMAAAETFGRLATVETHRRGTETAGTVCAVMDGAEWQQSFLDLHRPDAVRILDFPHAAEYVARAGQAVFGAGSEAAAQWLTEQLHDLKHGAEAAVLERLSALREQAAASAPSEALETIGTSLAYLEKRRAQLRYAEFQAQGYPIGSGMVESGNKLVTEARLKGAGMHWAPEHVNPMVALRTVVCADRWDEGWARISARLRAARRDHRTPTRHAQRQGEPAAARAEPTALQLPVLPVVPQAEPPAMIADPAARSPRTPSTPPDCRRAPPRPGPNHPWRRPLIPPDRRQPLAS